MKDTLIEAIHTIFDLFKKKRKTEFRDFFYVDLSSAIEKPGCPICNIIDKIIRDLIFEILYEHVNDPLMRAQFRKSLGLCGYHAWLLYKYSQEDPLIGEPGPAIIYRDMLETYYEYIDDNNDINQLVDLTDECYLCNRLIEFNDIFVEKFGEKIIETDLMEQYVNAEKSILCNNHLVDVIKYLKNEKRFDTIKKLMETQRNKINFVIKSLGDFIDSFDYRSGGFPKYRWKPTMLAIQILKGSSNTSHIYLVKLLKQVR